MNESLLKATIELLALLSNIENLTDEKKVISFSSLQESLEQKLKNLMARKSHVQWYLSQEVGVEAVSQYLQYYDKLMETSYQISVEENQIEIAPFDYRTVYGLAGKLNKGLSFRQKLVVFVRLLEYVLIEAENRDKAVPIFEIITEIFNFEKDALNDILDFLSATDGSIADNSNLLLVDANCGTDIHPKQDTYKTYQVSGIREKILLLSLPKVNFLLLRYFGSGLSLNGHLISPARAYAFTPGSKLTTSDSSSIYFSILQSCFYDRQGGPKVVLNAQDVEYRFKTGDIGIRSINISESTGSLVGIMGGSGSGKSTLLNVLNGNLTPSNGEVTINGFDVHHDEGDLEGVIGYVSQDDLLIEELTVFQNLYFNSKLCFDDLTDAEIRKRVDDMLSTLGLAEAAHLKVGSPLDKMISGGQRKRLNIALELIRKPMVLFLDEPTSGLSSQDSENIMDFIKELSLKGQLIFVVIHQPSSDIFKMFDRMLILDIGGYPIYYGNPLDSVNYFKRKIDHVKSEENECPVCGNVNPEIIFEIIESKVLDNYGNVTKNRSIPPQKWFDYYKKEIEPKVEINKDHNERPESNFKKPNVFSQFGVFIMRDVLAKMKNNQYILINFLEAPALSFILAYFLKYFPTDESSTGVYTYFGNSNIPVFIFIAVVVSLFIGLTVSAEEIIRDRKIRKRESFLNLSKMSYLGSKVIYLFLLSGVQMLTFVLIGNYILEIKGMIWDYWLMLFSTACFANMLGLNISATFKSVVTVYILIPFLIIPQIIFSGVMVPFEELNPNTTSQKKVPLIGDVMVSRWAFEAMAVNQFKTNGFERHLYDVNKDVTRTHYFKNYWISELNNANRSIYNHRKDEKYGEQVKSDFRLLANELGKHSEEYGYPEFGMMAQLKQQEASEKLYKVLDNYLDDMKTFYNRAYNDYIYEKDQVIQGLLAEQSDRNKFFNALRRNYKNENLSNILTNRNEVKKIVRLDDELIQRENVIYVDSDTFRSPFFTPSKNMFGAQVKTYWANTMVIWFFSILLGFMLYFDAFKRFGALFSGLGKRRRPKRVE